MLYTRKLKAVRNHLVCCCFRSVILKKHVREVSLRLYRKVASRCHALGNELGEEESARTKNGMEVAEIAGQVSASIEYILSCEVTEVGDAILECCPNVCAGTDAVQMFGLCGDHRSQVHDTSCRVLRQGLVLQNSLRIFAFFRIASKS